MILVGGTNCNVKCHQNGNAKSSSISNLSEFQLEQLIRSYTRVAKTLSGKDSATISKTVIDHISTKKPKYILKVDTIETGMVDHYMIYGIRKINTVKLNSFKKQKLAETKKV